MLLPDELMADSSLLAADERVVCRTGGSVVGVKRVPRYQVARTACSTRRPGDDDGVVPVRDLVEKPPVASAPSDLIIIGRYV